MTVHKAQGRTIPRVVLALSHRHNPQNQMTHASIYVALSRVEHSTDLKVLYHGTGTHPGRMGLDCVTDLNHCVHVLDYYEGFDQNGNGLWNAQNAITAKKLRLQNTH